MKKITTLLMLALMTTFGWQANSQNGGDTCATAVVAAPGIYSDAAIVPGTGGATQGGAADALWYSYTPAEDGLMSINSCASDPDGIDTRLYVYADGCDTLTLVANDDDGCDAPNTFGSLVADVAVVAGQEYLIQWDDRWGALAFDWELTGPAALTGLSCDNPTVATPGVYSDVAITPGSGSATEAGATDALWYSYTAEGDGTIGINSCASDPAGIDTRLYVYTDGCVTLTPVANDDDGCDAPNTFGSLVADVAVVGGQEYLIQWDDRWGAAAFDWELTFTPAPPTGLACDDAFIAVPGVYSDAIITPGSGSATQAGATDALWYSYTAEGDGTIGINSCASDPVGIDTRLYVYTDGCDTLTPVANDDDGCDAPTTFGSLLADVAVVSGQEYLIQWDDRWGADAFDWELTFTPNLDPTELPITLENQLPGFGDFNGSFTQAIANPDASGANTSATVAENTVPANAAFAGVNFGLDTNIDITTQKGFNLTVWSPVANIPVLLKLENGSGANAEVAATTTTTGAWETISFDFSAVGQLTYESVTLFMNFNQTDPATQVYYWDNLEQVDVVITGGAQIVEIDADQTGTDDQEFVEIKTEFANQSLNGMIAVFYNGSSDTSYRTVDLTGFASDDNGYFLLGSDAVAGADITMGADNTIQNGADAVALHTADAANFPDGTPVTTDGLVDAVVYGTSDADDTGLLTGLGQTTQWDENENGAKDTESLQFDATTGTFCAQVPTPRAANILCGPAAPLVELPITLEDGQLPGFGDFNGSFTQAIANPDATGENTSATVAENTVPANAGFAGVNFALDTNIDITTDKFFTMAVWSQVPNMPVLLKLENASGANAEVAVNTTTTGAWETITFDFSAIGQLTYESVTLFMNFALTDPATQVYYWDNLAQTGEPVGDDGISCAVAIPVTPGVYNDAAITVGSGGAAQDDAADALWYVYTAEADGTININSCFSVPEGIDTRLNVYTDGCDTLTPVANDDDGCDAPTTFGSILTDIDVVGGQDYLIEWDDRWGADAFDWELTFTPAPTGGIVCAEALAVTPGVYNDVFIVVGGGGATQDDAADALWYSFTPAENGLININSCFSVPDGIDTRLNVYTDGCDTLTPVADSDDDCEAPNVFGSSLTEIEVTAGQEYLIEWDDRWSADAFDWELTFTAGSTITLPITYEDGQLPAFGDFNGSFTQVIANPDATGVNTSANVAENTVPPNAAFAGVNFGLDVNIDIAFEKGFSMDVWSPLANIPVLLKLENATTGVNAEIAATTTTTSAWETISFDFTEFGDLTFESVTVFMNFNQTDGASQTYYWDNLVQSTVAPANDLCDNAIELECGTTVTGDTTLATLEGAPEEVCDTALNTAPGVWYTLTFPAGSDYNVTVDTFESPFDTKLGVFSGACDALVCVGGNDDTGGVQSQVEFVALAGETYSVYVTGFGSNTGLYNLTTTCEEILGLDNNTIEGFTFYPNPSSDVINLNATENIERVTIYNMLGQKVLDQNINATSSQLDVANLVTGTYLMEVYAGGKTASHKVIKK